MPYSIGSNLAVGALSGTLDAALDVTPRQNFHSGLISGALFAGLEALGDHKFHLGNFASTLLFTTAMSSLSYYAVNGMRAHKAHAQEQHEKKWVEYVAGRKLDGPADGRTISAER